MAAFLYRMGSGIAGDISRRAQSRVEPQIQSSATPFSAYGLVGKMSGGKFVPFTGSETTANVYGVLVRSFPTNSGTDPLGTATPNQGNVPVDVLRSGYMTVKCNAGTPAAGGQVYVRVAAATGSKPLGGVEAVADSTNTITPNATFMGPADANGNVEIAFNI
jgi:hypothetical protein